MAAGEGNGEDGQDGNIPGESFGLMSLTNCSAKQDLLLLLLPACEQGGATKFRLSLLVGEGGEWMERERENAVVDRERREKRGDETESRSLERREEEEGEKSPFSSFGGTVGWATTATPLSLSLFGLRRGTVMMLLFLPSPPLFLGLRNRQHVTIGQAKVFSSSLFISF